MLIKNNTDAVYIGCFCGCSIISIFNIDENRWYLQFYGYCKDKNPDFEMTTADLKQLSEALRNAVSEQKKTDALRESGKSFGFGEKEICFINNRDEKECLCVTCDACGGTNILKYRKNYKKFLKIHEQNVKIGSNACVEYKKCRCDWDLCLATADCDEIAHDIDELLVRLEAET